MPTFWELLLRGKLSLLTLELPPHFGHTPRAAGARTHCACAACLGLPLYGIALHSYRALTPRLLPTHLHTAPAAHRCLLYLPRLYIFACLSNALQFRAYHTAALPADIYASGQACLCPRHYALPDAHLMPAPLLPCLHRMRRTHASYRASGAAHTHAGIHARSPPFPVLPLRAPFHLA